MCDLTNEERQKFIKYLEEDANSSEILIKQMESKTFCPPAMVKAYTAEMHAARIVAKKLKSLHLG